MLRASLPAVGNFASNDSYKSITAFAQFSSYHYKQLSCRGENARWSRI